MDKFQNKYRIQSHRMPRWDYSGNGYYFITLVTQNRDCILGEIVATDGGDDSHVQTHGRASRRVTHAKIQLSGFGQIVDREWLKSFEIRDELFLDEYIIMPNHLHAIVILKKSPSNQSPNQPGFNRKPKSISSFVAGFKSAINSKINDFIDDNHLNIPKYSRDNHFFQPNYHDHIIRDEEEYLRIKKYILSNPAKWMDDTLNLKNTTPDE